MIVPDTTTMHYARRCVVFAWRCYGATEPIDVCVQGDHTILVWCNERGRFVQNGFTAGERAMMIAHATRACVLYNEREATLELS